MKIQNFTSAKKCHHTYFTFQHRCHPFLKTFGIMVPAPLSLPKRTLLPMTQTILGHKLSTPLQSQTVQTEPLLDVKKQVVVSWCKIRTVGRMEENLLSELFNMFDGCHCSVEAYIVMLKNVHCYAQHFMCCLFWIAFVSFCNVLQ